MDTTISNDTSAGNNIGGGTDRTLDKVTSAAHRAVDKVANAAAPAEGWIREKGSALKEKEEELVGNVVTYVREHPVASLGIAMAAGFLIGALSRSGSRDS